MTRKISNVTSAAILLTAAMNLLLATKLSPSLAARPSMSPLIVKPSGCYDFPIRLRRILILDATGRNTHVWQLLTKDDSSPGWVVYGSLYSPQLRKLVNSYPRNTFIGWETRSSDPVRFRSIGEKPTSEEMQDDREQRSFTNYCNAHGLKFGMLPVA